MQEITEMDLELINLIDHDTTKIFQHKIPLVYKADDESISEEKSLEDIYHENKRRGSKSTPLQD
jgi:hypothetical protein